MHCPHCEAEYPPPTPDSTPHLHCHRCGVRLFAWLGDPFGQYDLDAPEDEPRGVNWVWTLLVALVIVSTLAWLYVAILAQ